MKRSFWILAFLAVTVPSQAETRVGLVGGLSLARIPFGPDEPGSSFQTATGFAGGAMVDLGLGKHLALSLQPMFVRKGGKFTLEPDDLIPIEPFTISFRLDYVELSALLRVRFGEGSVRPYLLAGPTAGYRLSAKATAEGETVDAKDSFKEWDYGISAGAGLAFPAGKASGFLEARYDLGLANVGEGTAENETVKNRCVLVLAGITFGVGGH